jgi:hypothetical protein
MIDSGSAELDPMHESMKCACIWYTKASSNTGLQVQHKLLIGLCVFIYLRHNLLTLWLEQVQTPLNAIDQLKAYSDQHSLHSLVAVRIAVTLSDAVSETVRVSVGQRAGHALLREELLIAGCSEHSGHRDGGDDGEDGCELHVVGGRVSVQMS